MPGPTRTVSVELQAKIAGYVTNLRQAAQATKALEGELVHLGSTSPDQFAKVTKYAAAAGVALLALPAAAVKLSLSFDKTMSQVGAVADANAAQLSQLRKAAIAAGQATIFSASDAAQAEAELAKAGVSTADILGGALLGAMNLAAAGGLNLADAATYVAQDLNIFGIAASNTAHVADVLTAAANKSATDVPHLALAINQAGLVAHQTGMSFEDTAGTLALFAQNGLVGSDAGTSFKVMLQQLQKPSNQAKALMDSLGLSLYNAQGQFIGITGLAQQLQNQLGGLTAAQRDAAFAEIFGTDAVRSADILYEQGAAGVQKWIDAVNDSGAAAKQAKEQTNNLAGDLERLKGSMETLAISSASSLTSGLRGLTQGFTFLVDGVQKTPPVLQATASWMATIGGVASLGAAGWLKARDAVSKFTAALSEGGPAAQKLAGLLGKGAGIAGKLGLIGIAGGLAYAGLEWLRTLTTKNVRDATDDIGKLSDALRTLAQTGYETGSLAKGFDAPENKYIPQDYGHLYLDILSQRKQYQGTQGQAVFENLLQQTGFGSDYTMNAAKDIKNLNDALTSLAQNGGAAQALQSFTTIQNAMLGQGITQSEITKDFSGYLTAASQVGQANQQLANSTSLVTTAQGQMIIGMDQAVSAGAKLSDQLNSLSGANEDLEKANIATKSSMTQLTDGFKQNGKSVNDNTKAGQANITNLLAVIDNAKQVYQAVYNQEVATKGQTQALDDANSTYQAYLNQLEKTLIKEGLSKKQAEALIKTYGQIPPVVSTDVALNAVGADKALADITKRLNALPNTKNITVNLRSNANKVADELNMRGGSFRWGGVVHAATGLLNAGIYTSPTVSFAEPQTGGEGFVPRYGNYARSTAIIDTEASWYGGRFVPNSALASHAGSAAAAAYAPTINVYPQRSNMTAGDLDALNAAYYARFRVGRQR